MKFNTFLLNPGHVLVHFGPVLVQWLKKKSMWTNNEIALTARSLKWLGQTFPNPKYSDMRKYVDMQILSVEILFFQ